MSAFDAAVVCAVVHARLREEQERAERHKARENIQISTRRYRERAAAEARRSDDVRAVEQKAAAAEREEKEARKRVENDAQVKVERAATEAKERAAADERMNQQKNEEMAAAKSTKNPLKRLLQCWNCCS
ncbi:hypothetical protein MtrunA17_Chr2g0283591 [Medicago truncatula]|uniref:Uncharacterized protein n=1 Tax=Medicago truncatula TaxID=3880 RepID=G7IKC2_MEDTR|nr:auxilin-related protein 2 [Medicago truncatula]AES64004.1 hypothetical protein MTR_2g015740 [Medicago truncatula]RHN72063.1 hypothetical protein MtrunA17_Chr2g0283591 [Medicago truncatula]